MEGEIKMRFLIILVFFSLSFSAHAKSSQYRGHLATEKLLKERMLERTQRELFASYLGGRSLLDLLGTYGQLPNGDNHFQNGNPSPLNLLVWQIVIDGFARDVALSCDIGSERLPISTNFRPSLLQMCQWPNEASQDEASMQVFWLFLTRYDAPEEEFHAWREFLLTNYGGVKRETAIYAMVFSALYNPHFLLRK
jgi:hypothetical protein